MKAISDSLYLTFKTSWKSFLISLIGQLVIVSLLHVGLTTPTVLQFFSLQNIQTQTVKLVKPVKEADIVNNIGPKLELVKNDFILTPPGVAQGDTSADYQGSKGFAVADLGTGQILASKNLDTKLPIASITKIMTAVVALDLAKPDDLLTVSQKAAGMEPTKIGVVTGQRMKLEELLHAMMLTSANDATQVVKEGIDAQYGGEVFIKAMNEKAKILGLKNTNFTDPQGLGRDYSSPNDLLILAQYALKNYPLISQIAQKDYQFLPEDQNHKQFDLYNWNGLLNVYPGVVGLKIGNTEEAGYTTLVIAQREGKTVGTVLLGAPGVLERDLWASKLLDLGFQKLGLPKVGITEAQLKAKYSTWKYWG